MFTTLDPERARRAVTRPIARQPDMKPLTIPRANQYALRLPYPVLLLIRRAARRYDALVNQLENKARPTLRTSQ